LGNYLGNDTLRLFDGQRIGDCPIFHILEEGYYERSI